MAIDPNLIVVPIAVVGCIGCYVLGWGQGYCAGAIAELQTTKKMNADWGKFCQSVINDLGSVEVRFKLLRRTLLQSEAGGNRTLWSQPDIYNAHTIDILTRKDGVERRYEGDFLKPVAKLLREAPAREDGGCVGSTAPATTADAVPTSRNPDQEQKRPYANGPIIYDSYEDYAFDGEPKA